MGEPSPVHMSAKEKKRNQRKLKKLQTEGMICEYEKGKTIIIFPHTAAASTLLETPHIWGEYQRNTNREAKREIGQPGAIPTVIIDPTTKKLAKRRFAPQHPFNREHWERTPYKEKIEDRNIKDHIENLKNPKKRWIPQSRIDKPDDQSDEILLQLPPQILEKIRRPQ